MDLSTYRNVAITGYFDAVDGEGDTLTFQLTDTPARGSVELSEDGSARFVYTPYENKTERTPSPTWPSTSAGNTSPEARVTIRIDKPDTKVDYADLDGSPAHQGGHPPGGGGHFRGRVPERAVFSLTRTRRSPGRSFSPWPWRPPVWSPWRM